MKNTVKVSICDKDWKELGTVVVPIKGEKVCDDDYPTIRQAALVAIDQLISRKPITKFNPKKKPTKAAEDALFDKYLYCRC